MSPDAGTVAANIRRTARGLAEEAKEAGLRFVSQVKTPDRLREKVDAADRVGQILAFLVLGPFVMVSFQLIVVLNQLLVQVLGVSSLGSAQNDIFAWLVTGITGGAVVLSAWAWFQFVRTAGLGFFAWEEGAL